MTIEDELIELQRKIIESDNRRCELMKEIIEKQHELIKALGGCNLRINPFFVKNGGHAYVHECEPTERLLAELYADIKSDKRTPIIEAERARLEAEGRGKGDGDELD